MAHIPIKQRRGYLNLIPTPQRKNQKLPKTCILSLCELSRTIQHFSYFVNYIDAGNPFSKQSSSCSQAWIMSWCSGNFVRAYGLTICWCGTQKSIVRLGCPSLLSNPTFNELNCCNCTWPHTRIDWVVRRVMIDKAFLDAYALHNNDVHNGMEMVIRSLAWCKHSRGLAER